VDQELVIDRGLQPGETVVTEGQLRLTPGSHVQVQDGHEAGQGQAPAKTSMERPAKRSAAASLLRPIVGAAAPFAA
jgi:hypothetical protein